MSRELSLKGLMGGWSSFNHSSGSYVDVKIEYIDECENRLRRLFDQALLFFLEEEGNVSSLPAVLGDGENVDLFKLFVLVCEREGFDSVSRNGLWDSVAEKLGSDCYVSPSLRLVYSKYLDRMEKWAVEETRILNRDGKKKGCYGGMLQELGNGFKGLLENGNCQKRNRAVALGCNLIEESFSEFHRKRFRESRYDEEGVGSSFVDVLNESVVCAEEKGLDLSSKKKGGDLQEMLQWLTSVARSPHDPSIGVIPHCSKWRYYTGKECSIKAIKAKNALLVPRGNALLKYRCCPNLCHQFVHPSMYDEDNNDEKLLARSRYNMRSPKLSKRRYSSCSSYGRFVSRLMKSRLCREEEDLIEEETSEAIDLQEENAEDIPKRKVCIGPRYQAQLDEWTEGGVDSDSKWLGTRVWSPPENNEALDQLQRGDDLAGKGRPGSCSCDARLPYSVECVRLHIAENRKELKGELGDVFFLWKLDKLGEEVCLGWTEREEKRFKDMIIADPFFWKNTVKYLPGRKRKQLVHYYFNVFLINRRRYQNRVTPTDVDSDDDTKTFGSVGGRFGRGAVSSCDTDMMICCLNRQCEDY
ncbi:hypothetical protein CARUB_v10000553mg [Capsella rubella]|uniref:ARID domain-containing protein n=1 Tax=Capsella rubella TaxID=81985 RepID=R0FDL2_9BRAS|nr:AT-rich interactive domain-containing protein 2 [Capsella rubella]EOA20252.1 hypothetical protein CARUB_v10000553mg [Capsella rubella]